MDNGQATARASEVGSDNCNPTGTGQVPDPRSCDACRTRKVRCNREVPCSHCLRLKIECTRIDTKIKEKRTRILLTPQYERKIDQIDSKLNGVVELLKGFDLARRSSSASPQTSDGASIHSMSSAPRSHAADLEPSNAMVVEGDSSMAAHSLFATQFLQKIVGRDCAEMRESLDSLSHVVTGLRQQTVASEMSYPHARPIQRPNPPPCKMPPFEKAAPLIQMAKAQRLIGHGWIYEFLPFQRFSDMCMNVYFCEEYSEADFINVNAGLFSLFSDFVFHGPAEKKEEYLGYARECRDNLETALSNLPLHLPATSNTIIALVFGAFYAIDIAKPSLAWSLSSKSSELCQTLGYHRIESMVNDKKDDIDYKKFLFWSTYFVDKSLSLRLGRASTIPDWDITLPRPSNSELKNDPLSAYFVLWIETARCQGNLYEMLYSPNSIVQPHNVRQYRVDALVSALHELDRATLETNMKWFDLAKQASGETLLVFFKLSDEILRLSLLTMVYRAAPRSLDAPTTFSPSCIEAARATLDKHLSCMSLLQGNENYFPIYVHWTLLFAPFIPFIVIFCQVIETRDQLDLERLHTFIESIKSDHTVSESATKINRLFQALYVIAHRYVDFRPADPKAHQTDDAMMETYLASMGFSTTAPQHDARHQRATEAFEETGNIAGHGSTGGGDMFANNAGGGQRTTNPIMWLGNGAQLEDWFYHNQAMMDILESSNEPGSIDS
ncbi:hypothetical protein PFICI_04452 [Pestalotiopsis fici W106-1]|uniref:Zn(2)-C6 fungal-type domain-containing protein n=1 Tax=Pestalotiopsis fici (strain W106-1 / CGMCC3.15140) TaxID=1229662 RepID=W3XBL3_PESFW|nr:uncharacterized protein PFICI_04452 [Pestalotiopsis fici W106-1]ETS82576.1 hypothetical protein PFICI_04452 [Pestalotiopsis fici W106-1]